MVRKVIERRLASSEHPDFKILEAVDYQSLDIRLVEIFFDRIVDPKTVTPAEGAVFIRHLVVGGTSMLAYSVRPNSELRLRVNRDDFGTAFQRDDTALFKDKNALLAVRNGETAEQVVEWLEFHHKEHGAHGAVILDRAEPNSDQRFVKRLNKGLKQKKLDLIVVVLSCDLPLGKVDLPRESHPFNVPEAPGKDRMEIPEPSPWDSPLGLPAFYEMVRARFLRHARAVANLDVHDLAVPGEESIFDTALASDTGMIMLMGRHCYPWRVRNNTPTRFADHICVQFDAQAGRKRWCIAPSKTSEKAVWRLIRVGNVNPDPTRTRNFYRFMALRHPTASISRIVPKSSLIEHPPLLELSKDEWGHNPVRMPEIKSGEKNDGRGRCAIVTTMKNEGPFILEWLAYHRVIGFDDFLVFTNDCTDGTDTLLELLEKKGYVEHRDNPFREVNMKPQHAALHQANDEPIIQNANWVTCIDVDEYVNVKCGDGTLDALFAAVPDANLISMTWRLFGNGDVHLFKDGPIIDQFWRCAPEFANKPHQAWGFKTLFRNIGLFKKLGVHRPKGLNPQLWEEINWVNGSGQNLPREMYRNAWRSTSTTYGYDLVQLNHYAVRSAESFLVKRDRGRVNHVDRDQGLAYWFRMNNNAIEERSIERMVPRLRAEMDRMLSDPEIAAAHEYSVKCHRAKIDELKATENYSKFYAELTSARQEKLARLHSHFGANVFLSGPGVVPDEVVERPEDEEWFFTVELEGETQH